MVGVGDCKGKSYIILVWNPYFTVSLNMNTDVPDAGYVKCSTAVGMRHGEKGLIIKYSKFQEIRVELIQF